MVAEVPFTEAVPEGLQATSYPVAPETAAQETMKPEEVTPEDDRPVGVSRGVTVVMVA